MGPAGIMTDDTAKAATEADSPKPEPQAAADMPLLRIDAVSKKFGGFRAVDRLSLDIRAGEFFALLGPSGCGKTTLLRMLAGFAAPDEGRIFVDGEPIDPVPPWKRNLGMVFQQYALWPHMSVFENVAFGLRERRVSGPQLDREVEDELSQIGLDGFWGRR